MTSSHGPRGGAPAGRGAPSTHDAPDERDALIGCVLDDRYRLEERIGGGGMGQVYRARHLRMDQSVAVKVLHPDLSADPSAARRFAREARHTFRFDHPHCVRVIDFGATPTGTLFLVMEYLTGRTAAQEIEVDGPMAPERVMHIARQVCEALAYAHDLGFVHRDIKPDNLMLLHRGGDPDFVKVLDFGLAKLFTEQDPVLTAAFSAFALTREGSVFGTAEYMSPEQAMGQALAPTADVYSLGATMYELVTATLPFEGRTFTEVLAQQVQRQPVPPAARRPDLAIPAALDGLILACMAKLPGQRPQSAQALAAELDRIRFGHATGPGAALQRASTQAAAETMDLHAMNHAGVSDPALEMAATLYATGYAAAASVSGSIPARAIGASSGVSGNAPIGVSGSVSGNAPMHASGSAFAPAPLGASGHASGRASGPVAASAPPASTVPTAETRAHGRGANRRLIAVTAVVAVLCAAALGLALWRRTTAGRAMPAPPEAPAEAPAAQSAAAPATPTAATTGTGAAPDSSPAPAPAVPAAGDAERGQPAPGEGDAGEKRQARKREVAAFLAAAEAARRQSNPLKQIAAADSALRLEPRNRQAAFLLGDALLASGDEENACKYLRRARSLAEARAALRRARCPGD
jgi:hypothetical protein